MSRYDYTHGGNAAFESGREGVLDLSANINPLGMPVSVREAIINEISYCTRYPDSFSRELRQGIAEFENVSSEMVFCGNGASDIIFRLPRAIGAKAVMLTAPTFSDYERAGLSYGSEVHRYVLKDGLTLDNGFIEAVQRTQPDLVFICNPNNPTGQLTEPELIEELLSCCLTLDARVAVDECFLDFVEKASDYTSKVFLERYPNLVILKAFTKLFAMPGIRLGYALCAHEALMDELYFHGADWPVSNLAQAAGIAALEGAEDFVARSRAFVTQEREAMEQALAGFGYRVFKSEANYVFLQSPFAFDLCDELDTQGIHIRSCGNYHGLDHTYYRIAVSAKENNVAVLAAISAITPSKSDER